MERVPEKENSEQPSPLKVSDEIRNAYASADFLVKGRDVLLEDYIRMKTEVRDVLTSVGLWSDQLDSTIDSNLLHLGVLGMALESIAKWTQEKPSKLKNKQLEFYRENSRIQLRQMRILSPQWETWINSGSPADLDKVGERLYFMSRASTIVFSHHFIENLEGEGVKRRIKAPLKPKNK